MIFRTTRSDRDKMWPTFTGSRGAGMHHEETSPLAADETKIRR